MPRMNANAPTIAPKSTARPGVIGRASRFSTQSPTMSSVIVAAVRAPPRSS